MVDQEKPISISIKWLFVLSAMVSAWLVVVGFAPNPEPPITFLPDGAVKVTCQLKPLRASGLYLTDCATVQKLLKTPNSSLVLVPSNAGTLQLAREWREKYNSKIYVGNL